MTRCARAGFAATAAAAVLIALAVPAAIWVIANNTGIVLHVLAAALGGTCGLLATAMVLGAAGYVGWKTVGRNVTARCLERSRSSGDEAPTGAENQEGMGMPTIIALGVILASASGAAIYWSIQWGLETRAAPQGVTMLCAWALGTGAGILLTAECTVRCIQEEITGMERKIKGSRQTERV